MAQVKASLRSKIGIFLIVFGFIFPVFGLLVPLLGLSTGMTTTLVAFFMVGGPEIFMIAGAALAGKEGIVLVKNRIKKMLGLPEGRYPAPRSQYYLAVGMMVFWIISLIVPYYIPGIEKMLYLDTFEWYYFVIGDVIFVIAFLFIGGDQLVTKLGKVFTWEPWELPPEKGKK
ncbi:MAG: hypothetical protein PVH48_06850 [Cyclobacteriaceae bacterium]|jgi:hypothetical protein